jgi:hypothetical protein
MPWRVGPGSRAQGSTRAASSGRDGRRTRISTVHGISNQDGSADRTWPSIPCLHLLPRALRILRTAPHLQSRRNGQRLPHVLGGLRPAVRPDEPQPDEGSSRTAAAATAPTFTSVLLSASFIATGRVHSNAALDVDYARFAFITKSATDGVDAPAITICVARHLRKVRSTQSWQRKQDKSRIS